MAEGRNCKLYNVTGKEFREDLPDFTVKTKNSDVAFSVEEQTVYASAAVLSIASPVLSEICENFRGKNIELPGIKFQHFVEFLRCIYPDILQEINETSVYRVLPLAHKYQVKNLRDRCIKLVLKIVKNSCAKNAKELYRHIKLSEQLDIPEVETLCVEMVSECSLDDMEKANEQFPILHGTDVKIIKMAIRRYELAKQDDFKELTTESFTRLYSDISHLLNRKSSVGYKTAVTPYENRRELQQFRAQPLIYYMPQSSKKGKDQKNVMKTLRLVYRYRKDDVNLKNKALESFLSLGKLENEDLELYRLLPEEIKRDLERMKPS